MYCFRNKFDRDWCIIGAKQALGFDVKKDVEYLAELGHPIACATFYKFLKKGIINHKNTKIDKIVDGFSEKNDNFEELWAKYRKEFIYNSQEYKQVLKIIKNANMDVKNIKDLINKMNGCFFIGHHNVCKTTHYKRFKNTFGLANWMVSHYYETDLPKESLWLRKNEILLAATQDFPGYTVIMDAFAGKFDLLKGLKKQHEENPNDIRLAFDYATYLEIIQNYLTPENKEKANDIEKEILKNISLSAHSIEFLDYVEQQLNK